MSTNWAATFIESVGTFDLFTVRITLFDGVNVRTELFNFSAEPTLPELRAAIRARAAQLDNVVVSKGNLGLQSGQRIDLTPDAPASPTPASPREQYDLAVQRLHKLKEQQADLMPVTQADVDAAQKAQLALWLDEYKGI